MTFRLGYITVNDERTNYCACHATELLRAQSLILDKTDGVTVATAAVVTAAVVHVHSAGTEVEVPRIAGVSGRGRPIVAEGPHVFDTSVAIADARGRQNDGIAVGTRDLVSTSVPRPLAFCF